MLSSPALHWLHCRRPIVGVYPNRPGSARNRSCAVRVNLHAVKTFLLALTAAVSFVAAIVVGFGIDAKKSAPDDAYRTVTRNR
jgi:hypothetical protein